jgi:hypothetical protein
MGFCYLWIDSLCIYQDSIEDWLHELYMMGDIYKGGICNIAATVSKDSSGGCFRQRLVSLIEPCMFWTQWTDFCNKKYHLCEDNRDLWKDGVERAPLLKRG